MTRRLRDIESIESEGRRVVELIASQCLDTLRQCWEAVKEVTMKMSTPPQPIAQEKEEEEEEEHNDRITLCMDIDGTMLCTNFDEADDVTHVNTRAGLREMFDRLLDIVPQVEIGIFTAASPLYAKGARRLINDLICGYNEDVFDFCVSHEPESGIFTDVKKDLSIIKKDFSKVLLVDNDPSVVVHPRNTVIVPEFDYDPRGRDPVFLDLAEMVRDLSKSGMTVPDFLEQKANENFIYTHNGLYYLYRYCAECEAPESPTEKLIIDSSFQTWDLYCNACFSGMEQATDPKPSTPLTNGDSTAPAAEPIKPADKSVEKRTQNPKTPPTKPTPTPKVSTPMKVTEAAASKAENSPEKKTAPPKKSPPPKKKAAPKPAVIREVTSTGVPDDLRHAFLDDTDPAGWNIGTVSSEERAAFTTRKEFSMISSGGAQEWPALGGGSKKPIRKK
eukprot:TRINITY_DN1850_c1_g1_i1.p1 TRINITY_DN1850_c1_g1~~TRINITY_DN1850_c1_g1_i1.p1  ORF type:complete len:459 (+),score=107.63 TRINITY_DN1850_c1_g1_i1:42-1379(+)